MSDQEISIEKLVELIPNSPPELAFTSLNNRFVYPLFKNSISPEYNLLEKIQWAVSKTGTVIRPEKVLNRVQNIDFLLKLVSEAPVGHIAECGVYQGFSALLMIDYMNNGPLSDSDRRLFLFDTFSGLPDYHEKDYSISKDATGRLQKKSGVKTSFDTT